MAKYDLSIREGEVKNLVRDEWFGIYDTKREIGNIDLSVCVPVEQNQLEIFDLDFFLWAEAKKGNTEDIDDSFVQLIITIMKARTYNDYLPPKYLGAFDAEKIAFIEYNDKLQRQVIFDQVLENKIDWTRITPSDHNSEEFQLVKKKAKDILDNKMLFDFVHNEKDLRLFIKSNFKAKTGTNKINITLNRMTSIFNRWLEVVKPTIDVPWSELENKYNISPADFFLADVISKNNHSLGRTLQVMLLSNIYQINKRSYLFGKEQNLPIGEVKFKDNQKAHKTFWNKYARPPRRKEREQMQVRRDLLIEPDRRERKGAYFTPHQWVDLSQEYLATVLNKDGCNWQEEYYVWDCCAGTGNLLFGLTEKERIFASTLDEADVTYMKTQENLLPAHVFQFDFLNDDLQGEKVPEDLRRILKDPEERKKLVIYINPPYAEAGNKRNDSGNKEGVTIGNYTYNRYREILSKASNELFAQFFIRIYNEIPSCILAEFSTLKAIQAPNFKEFRMYFLAKLEKAFIVPADTFDNVDGQFPIGFFIWNTAIKETFNGIIAKKYEYINKEVLSKGEKFIYSYDRYTPISKWFFEILDPIGKIGHLSCRGGNDFQGSPTVSINTYLVTLKDRSIRRYRSTLNIDATNLIKSCVFLAVRHSIKPDWYNDRDQFVAPNIAWKDDKEFQNDCLAYTLFHGQNRITSTEGVNHWIPFREKDVNAPMLFESHFMSDFIAGKCKVNNAQLEIEYEKNESLIPTEPIQFSPEAQAVMDAGRELWKYYMWHRDVNVNASYYDIRKYFQHEKNGKMNPDSDDPTYMRLWGNIKDALKVLAEKIKPKVYLYGFLLDETTLPVDEPNDVPTQVKESVKTIKPKAPRKSEKTVVHYHINAENISLQTDGTINIGEINEK